VSTVHEMISCVFSPSEAGEPNLCPGREYFCAQSVEPGDSNLYHVDESLCVQGVEPGESNLCPRDDGPQEEVR
jgi:hypothetical protein